MSNPPAAPQALLSLLLPADARETVSGDLLEEYRESRVPAFGERRAGLWYWRQVVGIWLREYWQFVVPVILLLVVHDLFNTFRAPSGASYLDVPPALAQLPLLLIIVCGVFVMAGAYGSWRTGEFAGGLVAALGTFVVMWLFMAMWGSVTFYPFAQVQQSNPYWIQAWQWSTHRASPPSAFGFNPDTPTMSFLSWIFWDGIGALLIGGLAMLFASMIGGGLGSALGLISRQRREASAVLHASGKRR